MKERKGRAEERSCGARPSAQHRRGGGGGATRPGEVKECKRHTITHTAGGRSSEEAPSLKLAHAGFPRAANIFSCMKS